MAPGARPPEAAIAVFARAPVAGAVKTRLIPALGPAGAARLHERLVRRTLASACASQAGPVTLWCAPDVSHPFFASCREEHGVALREQRGSDLGERMRAAFEDAWAARTPLILVGSDCAALAPVHFRRAAASLASHDAVLCPAEDGGYVLVGMSRALPGIFDGIAWGGPSVMAGTRARLRAALARWEELDTLWDVDRPEDCERMRSAGWLEEEAA